MDIARLNTRITIQKCSIREDSVGNHTVHWAEHHSCYASVSNETAEEQEVAGATVDNTKADFTIRFCTAALAVDPLSYRVLSGGQIYDILAVDHMGYRRECVKLRCRKARR